jgi:hypothetical protein
MEQKLQFKRANTYKSYTNRRKRSYARDFRSQSLCDIICYVKMFAAYQTINVVMTLLSVHIQRPLGFCWTNITFGKPFGNEGLWSEDITKQIEYYLFRLNASLVMTTTWKNLHQKGLFNTSVVSTMYLPL